MEATMLRSYSLMVLALVLLSFVVTAEASGFGPGQGNLNYEKGASPMHIESRKMLAILEEGLHEQASNGHSEMLMARARELRTAPSGPDPLHHNGGSPKKPSTP